MDYKIIIYVFFGLLPSLIWLFYYLRKDLHPEPRKMIIKIFLWGALTTLPVFFIQIGFLKILDMSSGKFGLDSLVVDIIYWFFIISFTEELFKYFVVKFKVVNSPHLDEPLDIMLYSVIAALGFAAVENILYLFIPEPEATSMAFHQIINRTVVIDIIRFLGAVFLHTLCSAVIGYSLAISFCEVKRAGLYVFLGILSATLLHGLYDFSIMRLDGDIKFLVPIIIMLLLAFLVFSGFEKLKNSKGVCKIN